MEKNMKWFSMVMVMVMMFSLMPQMGATAFAISDATKIDVSDTNSEQTLPAGVTYASNKFTIGTGASDKTVTVTGITTVNAIVVDTGVTGLTLVLDGVSITSSSYSGIDLQGTANVTLQLADGTTNTVDVSSASDKAGICTNGTASVSITGEGILNALGGNALGSTGGAGIGGRGGTSGGSITISGGTVTATGGSMAAGIGGGGEVAVDSHSYTAGGTITISGGTVTALGGRFSDRSGGAGIGGGGGKSSGVIAISGGTVTGTGTGGGAGIGGGYWAAGEEITISNGTVNASGIGGGAGIGGGGGKSSGVIAISGGTVTASGTPIISNTIETMYSGAGIGGGGGGAGDTITISGGIVNASSTANFYYSGAGIGGGGAGAAGVITISGGVVNASSTVAFKNTYNPAIGIGSTADAPAGGSISVSGGKVTATGGNGGAGIGGSGGSALDTITIAASALVMAASDGVKPAIYAKSGSSGSVINATLSGALNVVPATYLKCGEDVLKLPTEYLAFAFSTASDSPVGVYSDLECTTKKYDVVTEGAVSATAIPVSDNIWDTPTPVKKLVERSVGFSINPSNGQVAATVTRDSGGTLYYNWTGGASGTGNMATPALGSPVTCTVTESGVSGSIQATTTVYKVTVTKAGITGADNASITNAYGKVGSNIRIAYTLEGTGAQSNTLTYSGGASNPAVVSMAAVGTPVTGTSIYTIVSGDAQSGIIGLTATFSHKNAGQFGGGSGTSEDPYLIGDATELRSLATLVNGGTSMEGVYYQLTTGVAISGEWTPIGTSMTGFSGNFDGNDQSISGVTFTTSAALSGVHQGIGFFGFTSGASIQNLNLVGVSISAINCNNVGGLVGYAMNTTLSGVTVTGTVAGLSIVGGLVGEDEGGTIEGSYTNVIATWIPATHNYAGGVIPNAS